MGHQTSSDQRSYLFILVSCLFIVAFQNTNVVKLYAHIEKLDKQRMYYNSGIGTYGKPSWHSWLYWKMIMENNVDLAIAWWILSCFACWASCSVLFRNFEKIILGGYHWLSENYECGDQIFLFSNGLFALIISGWTVLLILVLPGFSHGAYQVRVLAGMIERVGPWWQIWLVDW